MNNISKRDWTALILLVAHAVTTMSKSMAEVHDGRMLTHLARYAVLSNAREQSDASPTNALMTPD